MYIHINHHIRISIGIFSMIFVLYQPVLSLHLIYTCHFMTMANNNQFVHNTGLNKNNSLTHLFDTISPDMENEVDLVSMMLIREILYLSHAFRSHGLMKKLIYNISLFQTILLLMLIGD